MLDARILAQHAMLCLAFSCLPRLTTRLPHAKTREDRGVFLHYSLHSDLGSDNQSQHSPRAAVVHRDHRLLLRWPLHIAGRTVYRKHSKAQSSSHSHLIGRWPSTRASPSQEPQTTSSLCKIASRDGWRMHHKRRVKSTKWNTNVEPKPRSQAFHNVRPAKRDQSPGWFHCR